MNNVLITLKGYGDKIQNKRGFAVDGQPYEAEIFASVRSAGVIEHYEAMKAGVKVTCIFMVDTDSYKAAMPQGIRPVEVDYDGETFRIHNVRRRTNNYAEVYRETEIVCEEMV